MRCRTVIRGCRCGGRSVRSTVVVACLLLAFWLAGPAYAASFDEQRAAMRSTLATQPEAAIQALLEAGIAEGKPVLAISDVQMWLRQNMPEDPMLLYQAGRAAELSADWKGAVALYQQYLKKADLKSATADEAVYAVYMLLIERLSDTAGAYSFARTEGGRVLVCPRAKQFDTWFLDEAVRRGDAVAVANRLRACIEAGLQEELLIARYDNYFRWLLEQADGGTGGFVRAGRVTPELLEACKALIASMSFFDDLKARLDWAISVRFYVHERLAGKDVAAPIAEATALLAKDPDAALWVQTGWVGGTRDNHPNYVGDYKHYWAHEIEAKMAPIAEAAEKMSPMARAALFETWRPGYYGRQRQNPGLLDVKAVRERFHFVRYGDKLTTRNGVLIFGKNWDQFTPEEAQAKVAQLAHVADPQASLIRALAAGGADKNFDKALAALMGPEAWRLPQHHDQRNALFGALQKAMGAPRNDEQSKTWGTLGGGLSTVDAKPEDPAPQRIATFKKLWADYTSAQPKIPSVYERLSKVLMFTPEMIPELLRDSGPDAQILVKQAVGQGMTGPDPMWKFLGEGNWNRVSTGDYNPVIPAMAAHRHRGIEPMKQQAPEKCNPHPLESVFRAHIAETLKQSKLVPWTIQAWINMQYPENNAQQIGLMQALVASPDWKAMPFEVQFAAREWFGKDAMTTGQAAWIDAADPVLICKDLLSLTNTADVATAAAALNKGMDGVKQSPVRIELQGLDRLAAVEDAVFADPKVFDLVLDVTDNLRETIRADLFGQRLLAMAKANRDPVMMHRCLYYLWQDGRSDPRGRYKPNEQFVESLIEESPSPALAMARVGQSVFTGMNAYGFNWQQAVDGLKSIAGKAAMKLGLIVIPVPQTHPAYPLYKSQAEWMTANEDSAWALLDANWDQLLPVHRELSIDYLMWVLQRTIYSRDDARMEELVKALLAWAQEDGSPWTTDRKIDLDIAYGDIAIQLGQLDNAHKIFVRTQQNPAYQETSGRHRAVLRRVMVERMAKRFEDALQTLSELDMEKIPELWAPSRYARAEVYYDMEEYGDAAEDIDAILARESDHADARIMQGKIQLKRQKLMEASELDVGSKDAKNTLVPGESLKVTLNDPTLAVSGAGTEVEVVVWATSGDKEHFFLRQFGDQKTKFRGEVRTALGKPVPDDDVLQVIGDDEIFYAYSERFRTRMNDMAEKRGGPITVRSDAVLMASARKLLSEAEQRVADMEAKMAAISKGEPVTAGTAAAVQVQAASRAVAAGRTREDREMAEADETARLAKELLQERVKPGRPLNVRVIDPDASRTAGIDTVTVSIESSSGDAIGRVVLKETDTHTGWFEGSIPTAGAQAMAFARHSEPGRNPNMVISPTPGYAAWRPVSVAGETPEFQIDLNDNVALGEMTITASEPGARLKVFALQSGMNAADMTTIGVFPRDQLTLEKPWHPSVTIMNDTDHHHVRDERSVYDLREIREHLERGWMQQRFAAGIAENVAGPSEALTEAIPAKVVWKRQNIHHNAHVIYRFQGYFHEPADVTRQFKVALGKWTPPEVHPSVGHPAQYLLAVDGRIITDKANPDRLEGSIDLKQGVHRFEIWATGWDCRIGFGRSVKVLANLDPKRVQDLPVNEAGDALDLTAKREDPATVKPATDAVDGLVEVPDSFFDPAVFPAGVLSHRNGRAQIEASEDGSRFTVTFAPGSRTRLLNLVLIGQEGPVPALNAIALTDETGGRVLPVAQDFAALNKNDILEILSGDKVAVRYVDDRFVHKDREKHERFLNVSFSNADVRFVRAGMHKGQPVYETLFRFEHDKPLNLLISDPDMDMTDEPDRVTVVLESRSGGKKTYELRETGPSTASFLLDVIPVVGVAAGENEFQVGAGETITAVYRDAENVIPGVPVDRYASIEHALYGLPVLRVAHALVSPIDFESLDPNDPDPSRRPPGPRGLHVGFASQAMERRSAAATGDGLLSEARQDAAETTSGGLIRPRWSLRHEWADASQPPEGGMAVVHGEMVDFEIEAPHLALRAGSSVEVYVQTAAGREQAELLGGSLDVGEGASGPQFDITVPGTMKLVARLGGKGSIHTGFAAPPQIPIYLVGPLDHTDGSGLFNPSTRVFGCRVPLIAGVLPEEGVLSEEELERRRERKIPIESRHGLAVRPGDKVHVGFRYTNQAGAEQWLTAEAKVLTHPVLDVMGEDYREEQDQAFAGESLYLRVVDLGADVSDASDTIEVLMQARSGAKYNVELLEVDTHSGVFRGPVLLTYAQAVAGSANGQPDAAAYSVKQDGFPVVYGDVVGVRYTDANGIKTDTKIVTIQKGADGTIWPFSKKYEDADVAMKTQFALAESYLEMAKRHRKLGETELADDEYARAKDMLEKAMEMFRDPETRAHAEYLLGSLTQEEADATEEPELREARYRAALSRYMRVTGSYEDTLYASKAQFKIATVYERMEEPEIAAQEYVKLAYKFPDSEFLALAMARLGTHFQRMAVSYEKQAAALLEKTDDKDAQFEGQAVQKMGMKEYIKSAEIFARLQARFPDHELAGEGGLRAGQAYMRAGETRDALIAFKRVFEHDAYDGPKIRAQAMYWAGVCYEKVGEAMAAYSIYKRLTYDFPESEWASFARGQLSQEKLLSIEEQIEIKRVEEGR